MLIVIFASFNISILLKKTEAVHWWFCLNLVPFQFGHRMIQSTQPKANTQKFNPNVINCIIWTTFANFLLYSCGTFQIATNQTVYPEIITLWGNIAKPQLQKQSVLCHCHCLDFVFFFIKINLCHCLLPAISA